MAGRPKRRAREQAAGEIPDALSAPDSAPTHAGAHARAGARGNPSKGYAGVQARHVVDTAAAGQLGELAGVLRVGTTVRIERVRPSWAAGFLEDLTLDRSGIGELLEHLQEEYGGKRYRVTVLMANGQPGYEASISIAGPPLDQGELIDRDEWNGQPGKRERERDRARNAIPHAATSAHPPTPIGELVPLFELMLRQNTGASDKQMAAVQKLVETSAAQNQELIQAIVESRTQVERGKSLAGQLGELAEAHRAVTKIGRMFGAAAPAAPEAADEEDVVSQAVREAGKDFIASVIRSEFMPGAKGRQQPQQPAPARRPLNPRPVQAASQVRQRPTTSIPDAMSHPGHNAAAGRN